MLRLRGSSGVVSWSPGSVGSHISSLVGWFLLKSLLVMDFHVPELGWRFILDFLLAFWPSSILPTAADLLPNCSLSRCFSSAKKGQPTNTNDSCRPELRLADPS